jgi:hypothetical protein
MEALANPIRREVQADGRVRLWTRVYLPGVEVARALQEVTLDHGVTVHNAFLDRGFREEAT